VLLWEYDVGSVNVVLSLENGAASALHPQSDVSYNYNNIVSKTTAILHSV
jgi:hypothetical protein